MDETHLPRRKRLYLENGLISGQTKGMYVYPTHAWYWEKIAIAFTQELFAFLVIFFKLVFVSECRFSHRRSHIYALNNYFTSDLT